MAIIKSKTSGSKLRRTNSGINFNDALHKYTLNGTELESVTTWLGYYFSTPFKKDNKHIFMANNKAKSNGNKNYGISNPKDLQHDWYLNGQIAASLGTAAHAFVERHHLNKQYGITIEPRTPEMVAGQKAYDALVKKWEIVELERRVGSEKYMLAGHIDAVIKNRKTGEMGLLDWKTIVDINKSYAKMNNELADFPDSPYMKATIQMNIYNIIGNIGADYRNLFVVQLLPDGTYKTHGGSKNPLPNITSLVLKGLESRILTINKMKKVKSDTIGGVYHQPNSLIDFM